VCAARGRLIRNRPTGRAAEHPAVRRIFAAERNVSPDDRERAHRTAKRRPRPGPSRGTHTSPQEGQRPPRARPVPVPRASHPASPACPRKEAEALEPSGDRPPSEPRTQAWSDRGSGGLSPRGKYCEPSGRRSKTSEHRATGGPGVSPRGKYCEPSGRRSKTSEHRATPGGYGGKPPGVAFIGVPTGARNAGSGAPTGDQSTGMHVTRNPPHVCQAPITSPSRRGVRLNSPISGFGSLMRSRVLMGLSVAL
jgi:hypothetical protein